MKKESAKERIDLGPEAILWLLKSLFDPSLTGQSPLAKTALVDKLVAQMNLKDSVPNRGLVLAMIIEDIIRDQQERNRGTEQGLSWDILARRFIARQPLKSIAVELSVGERTVSRIQGRALNQLASELLPIVTEKENGGT